MLKIYMSLKNAAVFIKNFNNAYMYIGKNFWFEPNKLQKATFLIIYRYKLKITYWLLAYFSFKFGLLLNSVNVKTNFNWSLKVSFSRIITYI